MSPKKMSDIHFKFWRLLAASIPQHAVSVTALSLLASRVHSEPATLALAQQQSCWSDRISRHYEINIFERTGRLPCS
jgi:hypothetical protein